MKKEEISRVDLELLHEKYPDNFEEVEKKLEENYPVQYLIGNVDFLNTNILVDERVLIPRFETELLVAKTIDRINSYHIQNPNILDLGCGSGCITIALKKNVLCEVIGVDISKKALELAKENAKRNNVDVKFHEKDMLNMSYEGADVIISNPPYVRLDEKVGLSTKYEPQEAIFASENGLYFYKRILANIAKLEHKPKLIALEIGMTQKEEIEKLASHYLTDYKLEIEKDLTERDRYAFLTLNTLSFFLAFFLIYDKINT